MLEIGIFIDLSRLQDARNRDTHRLAQITGFTHRCTCYRMLETGIFIDLHRSQDSLIDARVTGCSKQRYS
jgi:hypothetical protein